MWGYEDEAENDQALIDAAKTQKTIEKKIGLIWSKHDMIWFMENGSKEKRYVGALRLKKKTLTPETYKRLLSGERIIMQYDAEDKAEECDTK